MKALLLLSLFVQMQDEEVFSGPQAGEKTAGFKVVAANGDMKEKEHDFVTAWKGGPTLIVFIHEITRPAAQCFRGLDRYAIKKRDFGLNTIFVVLSSDQEQSERYVPYLLKAVKMECLLGVSVDGAEGPGAYGLNKDVTLTVLVAKDNEVKANFAILSPNETDVPKITKEIDKILPSRPNEPSLGTDEEMRAELKRLRDEVRKLRDEMDQLRKQVQQNRGPKRKRNPKPEGRKLPGKAPDDPALVELLRSLIQKTNEDEDVDKVIEQFEAEVGDDKGKQKQIVEANKLLQHIKYGTDYARAQFKKLAEKYGER